MLTDDDDDVVYVDTRVILKGRCNHQRGRTMHLTGSGRPFGLVTVNQSARVVIEKSHLYLTLFWAGVDRRARWRRAPGETAKFHVSHVDDVHALDVYSGPYPDCFPPPQQSSEQGWALSPLNGF